MYKWEVADEARKHEAVDVFLDIDMPPDGDPVPCWPWTGKINATRTGVRISVLVEYSGSHTALCGPRSMVQYLKVKVVRHKVCDNEVCCNYHHLLLGSQSDNEQDKYEHERWGFPHAVIEEIVKLREQHQSLSENGIAAIVSQHHGVYITQQRVSEILTGARRSATVISLKDRST